MIFQIYKIKKRQEKKKKKRENTLFFGSDANFEIVTSMIVTLD